MHAQRTPARRGWRWVEESSQTAIGGWRMVLAVPLGDDLAELVEAVWGVEGVDCFQQEEILPRSSTEVLFGLGGRHWLRDRQDSGRDRVFTGSFVSGLQKRPLLVESPSDHRIAGVRLKPAGAAAFLRHNPAAIAGEVVELDAVLGPGVEELRQQVAETRDLGRQVLLLAAAVARHLGEARRPSAPVRQALDTLRREQGRTPVRDLVRASGHSHRWFTERFRAEVGLAPKAYARVVRFEATFEKLCSRRPVHWADLAQEAGYFDQAHLVRDFRELAGASPGEVLRRRAPEGLSLLVDEDARRLRPTA